MIGTVDDRNRALIDLEVRRTRNAEGTRVTAGIDTAFDGHLVFPMWLIEELDLEPLVETDAILADGRKVILQTFIGDVAWFGNPVPLQVVANVGQLPLLGTGLLEEHVACHRCSSGSLLPELLGKPDENSFGAPDVAEPIRVFVLGHFADELRAAFAEPGERIVDVLHGEHDA